MDAMATIQLRQMTALRILCIAIALLLPRCAAPRQEGNRTNTSPTRDARIRGTEFGYEVLRIENENEMPAGDDARAVLDELVTASLAAITPKENYTRSEALGVLNAIHRTIGKNGIEYESQVLFSTGLRTRKLDCDLLSYVYLTVADVLRLPLYGIQSPRHFFLLWDDGTNVMYWETTAGKDQQRDYYINSPAKSRIAQISIDNGTYLRRMSRKESLAATYGAIARQLADLGANDRALALYDEHLSVNPLHVISLTNRGNCHERLKNTAKAITDHTRALELDPNYALAYANRATTYLQGGEYQLGVNDATACIKLDAKEARALLTRAICYAELRQYDKAIADATAYLQRDGRSAKAYFQRGYSYAQTGKYAQAAADFTRSLDVESSNPLTLYNRAWVLHQQKKFKDALRDYDAVLAINPNDLSALRNRATIHEELNENDAAVADYTRLIQLQPDNPDPFYFRAHCYRRLKLLRLALADFSSLIRTQPQNAEAYYWRAVTRSDLKEPSSDICGDLREARTRGSQKADEQFKKLCK